MVFNHTPLTPSPPLTLTMVFSLRIFKICTGNGQINTIKTGLNKDLVLGDPLPPSMVKDNTFALFNFGTLPLVPMCWGPGHGVG